MFKLCIFDLDQTLINSDDIKDIREKGKRNNTEQYLISLEESLNEIEDRHIYSQANLDGIRAKFPEMKMGVFTRSPRSYAKFVLAWAYPKFKWDIVVAYEDVGETKPNGEGIDVAMEKFDIRQLDQIMLVGDGDSDVRAAYHAGCVVVLDKGAWPYKYTQDHWRALGHIPDAIISSPDQLIDVLKNPSGFLPELERLLVDGQREGGYPRFERINHFIPKSAGGDKTAFPIYVCGRSFSGYESLKWRRCWHELTKSIKDQKDSENFPDAWVDVVKDFISNEFPLLALAGSITVCVIPHRPDRKARLEAFLYQIENSFKDAGLREGAIKFVPDLLGYKDGVRSNSNDHLNQAERFENIREHLYVKRPEVLKVKPKVLVIDDVTTTGSTLIYAKKYLEAAGAGGVTCLSLAKNISDVL